MKYKECLLDRFKSSTERSAQLRESLKEQLENELMVRYVEKIEENSNCDKTEQNLVYYLCGYLLKTRPWATECKDCKLLLLSSKETLPHNFEMSEFTSLVSKGKLLYATPAMFNSFKEVERTVRCYFLNGKHIYVRDSYEIIISKICNLNLMNICCDNHPETLPQLILDYVLIRFHFESKRVRNIAFSKVKTDVHSSRKKSTCLNKITMD